MSTRPFGAGFVLAFFSAFLIGGGFCAVVAQQKGAPAKPEVGPDPYTYTGKFYGFVTSSKEAARGHDITPDEIRKSVASGGSYILLGSPQGRWDLEPQEKAAPFAGQQVFMTLSVTTQKYGSGPTSDPSLDGYPAGGDRPATRRDTFKIIAVTPTTYNDAWSNWKRPEGEKDYEQ
jgi:hypothetical protein